MDLQISSENFSPGDLFLLQAIVTNPGPETYQALPFVVVLEAGSQYFWYPDWSTEFECERIDLEITTLSLEILRFDWPNLTGAGSDVQIYSALLNSEFSEIIGLWDFVSFGWTD